MYKTILRNKKYLKIILKYFKQIIVFFMLHFDNIIIIFEINTRYNFNSLIFRIIYHLCISAKSIS